MVQENKEFKVIFGYIVNSRSALQKAKTRNLLSKSQSKWWCSLKEENVFSLSLCLSLYMCIKQTLRILHSQISQVFGYFNVSWIIIFIDDTLVLRTEARMVMKYMQIFKNWLRFQFCTRINLCECADLSKGDIFAQKLFFWT